MNKWGRLTTRWEALGGAVGAVGRAVGAVGRALGTAVLTRCERSRRAVCSGRMSSWVADWLAIFEERW